MSSASHPRSRDSNPRQSGGHRAPNEPQETQRLDFLVLPLRHGATECTPCRRTAACKIRLWLSRSRHPSDRPPSVVLQLTVATVVPSLTLSSNGYPQGQQPVSSNTQTETIFEPFSELFPVSRPTSLSMKTTRPCFLMAVSSHVERRPGYAC
jgi:hypothetical protein